MKKIILTIAAVVLSAGLVSAQDMAQATETAKNANEALVAKDYAKALAGFKEALAQAEACGEEGEDIVNTCKSVIPTLMLNIVKADIKDAKYDESLVQLDEIIKVAEEYENDDVIAQAATLIPQVKKTKATALYNEKNYAAAAEAFKVVLADDPTDGASALRLAMALNQTGDKDGAIAAFEQAAENGQAANANKQLANIYLKDAQALLKDKKYKDALAACDKSNEYNESANAYKLAASAATNLKDNATAITSYEKYLELSPDAKDANGINYTLGVLYQQAGNKTKAIEFYEKVTGDAQYGAGAKQQIEALKK